MYIGSIYIPFLTSQDYQKPREVLERNFVGYSPQVYGFEPRLENGTFSFLLLDGEHPENYNLKEQRRAFVALDDYHATQNSFALLQDRGYLSFSNIETTREPDLLSMAVQADVMYMEDDEYRPAYLNYPETRASDVGLASNPYIALHPNVTDVQYRDKDAGTLTSATPDFTISCEVTDLDVYAVDGRQLIYENPSGVDDFTLPERESIVRAYDSHFDASQSPYYSGYEPFESGSGVNGLLRFEMESDGISLYLWDGSWVFVGTLTFDNASPLLSDMDNHSLEVEMDDGTLSAYRGEPFLTFEGTFPSFSLDTSVGDDAISTASTEGSHSIIGSGSTYDFFISRDTDTGSFNSSGSTIELTGISEEASVSVGYIVNSDTTGTLEWSQTDENIDRNLLARETI